MNGPRYIEWQSGRPPPSRTATLRDQMASSTEGEFGFLKFNLVVRTDCGPRFLAAVLHVFAKRLS
jgi:hypothetical protein